MTMRTTIAALLCLVPVTAISGQEELSTALGRWTATLPVDARIADEVGRFVHDGRIDLSEGYRSTFVARMRALVAREADRAIATLASRPCVPSVEVTYPKPGFADAEDESRGTEVNAADSGEGPGTEAEEKAEEQFEKSFIRTEMYTCFETTLEDPIAALQVYTRGEFRMAASSRIENVWDEGGLFCIETGGIKALLSPTKACSSIEHLSEDGLASEHSQVVWNEGGDPYQDMYFKESLKTFVRIPGGLALHYLNYSRTTSMGRMQRWVGTGKIEDSQRRSAELMAQRLPGGGP